MKSAIWLILLATLLCGAFFVLTGNALSDIEVDACGAIYNVVDGDTFDAFPLGRVRLADINAPEIDTLEGAAARDALANLSSKYGPRVYLDVDDVYVMDRYNRIVAVAYLRYNSTHLLNINKWLLEGGYAEASDYKNEFDPRGWQLYLYHPDDLCREVDTVVSTVTKTETVFSTISSTTTTTNTQTVFFTVTATVTRECATSPLELVIVIIIVLALIIAVLAAVAKLMRRK